MYEEKGKRILEAFKFPLDGEMHCNEWYSQYIFVILTIIGIAILIIIGNIIVEVVVIYGAQMTRPVNE
jgi:hypothetical protein